MHIFFVEVEDISHLLTDTLIRALEADEEDLESSNDFGKNIIPKLLHEGARLFSYPFSGYWKDVGTIGSLWEANMDLLGEQPVLNLGTRDFRIYSRNFPRPPQYIGDGAIVKNTMISEGSAIEGTVENSILSGGVTVEKGAVVKNSILMEGVTVRSGASVYYSIVDSDTVIGNNVTVGDENGSKDHISVIAKNRILLCENEKEDR